MKGTQKAVYEIEENNKMSVLYLNLAIFHIEDEIKRRGGKRD